MAPGTLVHDPVNGIAARPCVPPECARFVLHYGSVPGQLDDSGEGGCGMLTTFGRLLATSLILVLLLALASYLFLFTSIGPDLICDRRTGCIATPR